MKNRSTYIFVWVLLACAALWLQGCGVGGQEASTPTPIPAIVNQEKDIFTVTRGSIVAQHSYPGEIVPAQQDGLYFLASGYIERVSVETGDIVKSGDLLAELQMDDLRSQLQQAYIDLQVSQDNLSNLDLQHAYEIQKAEDDLAILEIQLEQVQERLDTLTGPIRDDAIRESQILQKRLDTAQSWLRLVLEKRDTSTQGLVDRNQLTVDRLEKQVLEHQIYAPYDGIILTSYLKPGNSIDAFSTAFLIGDPNNLVIRIAYINELVNVLKPGVEVYMSFYRNITDQYPVQFLPDFLPVTNKKEGVVSNDPRQALTYYYFTVPAEMSVDQIPIGSGVSLDVIFGRKENALLLSPAAIRGETDFKYVIVLENEIHRRLELLRIGLKGDTYWEVEGDLKEGDLILGP